MKYDFDKVIERRGTYSMKWDGMQMMKKFGFSKEDIPENAIPMMTADMDLQSPQPVLDALKEMIDTHKMFGYTADMCEPRYAESLCEWFKRRHNWDVKPEEVFYSHGTFDALACAVKMRAKPGDGVIVMRPVYGHFSQSIVGEWGCKAVSNRLIRDEEGRYTIDFADLEEKCADPNNKVLIFCSPANPVGRVWTPEEIQKVHEICCRHNVLIVSDEVHCDLLRKGVVHHPFTSVLEDKSNVVVMVAINKSFNMAGLATSNAVIQDPELREEFKKAYGIMHMPSPFAICAQIAAYTEGDDWMDQVNEYIDGNIDWAIDFFKKNMPKVKIWRPEGTYVLWMDFTAYGLSDEEVHKRIYQKAGVLLQDGIVHDPEGGQCFQRMCLPCARSVLQEACERIAAQFKDVE